MQIKCSVGCIVALIFAFSCGQVNAQSVDNKEITAKGACTDLDFLAGNWEVHGSDGSLDATVRIKLSAGRCYGTEFWNLSKEMGGQGICFTAYSNRKHSWTNICGVGRNDRYRFGDGRLYGNEIRFLGEDMPDGVTQVFSFYSLPDKRIHELLKESSDGGKTWKTLADEYWSRKN